MTDEAVLPTSDERLLAAVSHFLGLMVAFIVWATQKDKSAFVRFQAMQALAFDLIVLVVVMAGVGVLTGLSFGVMAIAMLGLVSSAGEGAEPGTWFVFTMMPILLPALLWVPPVLLSIVVTAVRAVAAFNVLQGRDFRYPWLGRWVEEFLAG